MPKMTAAAMPRTLIAQSSQKSRVSTLFGAVEVEGELGVCGGVAMGFPPALIFGVGAVGIDILEALWIR
jgi:hypothetical protein